MIKASFRLNSYVICNSMQYTCRLQNSNLPHWKLVLIRQRNISITLMSLLQCYLVNSILGTTGTKTNNPVFSTFSQVLIHTFIHLRFIEQKQHSPAGPTYMYDCAFSFGSVPNFAGCNVLHCTKCNVPPALVLEQILCSTECFVKLIKQQCNRAHTKFTYMQHILCLVDL